MNEDQANELANQLATEVREKLKAQGIEIPDREWAQIGDAIYDVIPVDVS